MPFFLSFSRTHHELAGQGAEQLYLSCKLPVQSRLMAGNRGFCTVCIGVLIFDPVVKLLELDTDIPYHLMMVYPVPDRDAGQQKPCHGNDDQDCLNLYF